VELEQQQMEGEDRLTNMAAQAQDYAALLEQAQNTIHHLGESRLLLEDDEEDDGLSNNDLSTISSSTGYNETITKVKEQKWRVAGRGGTELTPLIFRAPYSLWNSDKKCKRKSNAIFNSAMKSGTGSSPPILPPPPPQKRKRKASKDSRLFWLIVIRV
jgi:hypothetical protein